MAWAKFSCASLDDRGKLASFAPSGESKSKAKGATAGRLTVQRAEDELPANLPALLKLLGGAGGLGQHATATPFSASIGKHEVEVDTARLENVKQMPLVLEIKVLADGAKFNGVSGSLTDVHSQECLATGTIKLDQLHSSAGNEIDLDCSQAESQGVQMKMKVKLGPLKTTPTTAATLNALAKQDWDLKDIAKVLTDASAARKLTMEETYQTIGGPESEKRCQQVWFNLAHGSFTPLGSLKTDLVQWGRLAFEAGSFVDRYADITRAVQISVAKRLHSQGMTLDATSLARLSSQAAASSDVRKDLATAFHSELTKTCALNSVYRSDQAVKCVKLNISGGKTTADVVLESGEAQNTLGRESNATALQRDRKLEQLQYKSAAEFAEGQRLKHTMPGDCEDLAAKAHQAYRKLHTEQRDTFRAGVKQSFETNHSNPSHVNTLLVDIATHIQTGAHELRRDGFSWGATLGFARGAKVADNKAQSQDSQHTDGLSVSENFANRVNKIATHEVMGHAFQCADELIASQELPNGATLCVKKIANIAESTAVTDVNTALPHDNVTVNAELHTESSVDAVKRIKKTLPFDVAINLKTEIIGKELARRSGQNVVTQHYGNPESESSFWNMLIASADENGDTSFFCDISHRHGQTDLDQLFKMQWAHQGHQLAVAEHVCAHAAEQLLNCACACVVGKAKARVPCCRCPDCGECELPRHARALSALVDAGERDLGNIGAEFEAVHDLATACGACGADKAFVNELNTETLAWTDDGRGIDIDKNNAPVPPSMNLNPPAFRCPLTTLTLAAAAHASGVAKGGAKKRRAAKTGIAPLSIAPLAGIAGELKRNDGLVFSIKMPVPEGSEEMAALRALGAVMAGYVVSSSNMDADKVMPFDKHFAGCEGPVTFGFETGATDVPVVVFTPRQQRIALAPSLKAARQISAEKFDPEKEIKARQKFAESQGLVVKMHLTESDCMYALCK